MSKFWGGGDDSSSEEDYSGSESGGVTQTAAARRNLFLDDDSSDDDDVRVVLTASEKLRAAIGDAVRETAALFRSARSRGGADDDNEEDNADGNEDEDEDDDEDGDDDDDEAAPSQRPNVNLAKVSWKKVDWHVVETECFPKLMRVHGKCLKALNRVPSAWAAGMVFLEDAVAAASRKENKATMSKAKAKSVQSLVAKLGKLDAAARAQIDKERAEPTAEETDEEDMEGGADGAKGGAQPEEEIEWTEETVQKKIDELIAMRGKRGTKLEAMLKEFDALAEVTESKAQSFAIRLHMLSARFDSASNLLTFMPIDLWNECHEGLIKILDTIEADQEISAFVSASAAASAEGSSQAAPTTPEGIAGSLARSAIAAFTARLDDELVKSLQFMDHHTERYLVRLADERVLLKLLPRVADFYDALGLRDIGTAMCFRRLEHLYFTTDTDPTAAPPADLYPILPESTEPSAKAVSLRPSPLVRATEPLSGDVTPLVQSLAARVFRESRETIPKIRSTLCLVYHHAVSLRYERARDLLLMSGLHSVLEADVATQVLYNRVTAALGLAAFKLGLLRDAHTCLQEVCSSGRTRELLGQGTGPRFGADRTVEQERAERRRQFPWHMHISLDALELAHLVSAMYLEVPSMAARRNDARRRVISKSFRRVLEIHDRQIFQHARNPPPAPEGAKGEPVRDCIIRATGFMRDGDWERCVSAVCQAEAWSRVDDADGTVRHRLSERLKRACLRTFLFLHADAYESVGLTSLATRFGVSRDEVMGVVSRMIVSDELPGGGWRRANGDVAGNIAGNVAGKSDEKLLSLSSAAVTPLQALAATLADKASQLVDYNEKLYEQRTAASGGGHGGHGSRGDGNHGNNGGDGHGGSGGHHHHSGGGRGRGGYRGRGRGSYGNRGGYGNRGRGRPTHHGLNTGGQSATHSHHNNNNNRGVNTGQYNYTQRQAQSADGGSGGEAKGSRYGGLAR